MTILLLLIPLGLVLLAMAVWAFFWAVDHDQFDDLDRAARSILFDDDLPREDAAPTDAARPPASPGDRDAST